jgi:hypothetical protein
MHLEVKEKKEIISFSSILSIVYCKLFIYLQKLHTSDMSSRHSRNLSASLYVRGLAEKVR